MCGMFAALSILICRCAISISRSITCSSGRRVSASAMKSSTFIFSSGGQSSEAWRWNGAFEGRLLARPVDIEQLAERDLLRDEVGLHHALLRLLVAQAHLRAQHIEPGRAPRVEEVLLPRAFLLQQLDGQVLRIKLRLVDDDGVDGDLHLLENRVDRGLQAG